MATVSPTIELAPDYLLLPLDQQETVRKTVTRLSPPPKIKAGVIEEYNRTIEGMGRAVKEARILGFKIIEGTPSTLLLDLDGDKAINEECLKMLCDLVKEVPIKTSWKSKNGGTHVVLQFESITFTPAEAVAMEVALGSDQKRAALYVLRLKNGVPQPRVLFMPQPPPDPLLSPVAEMFG